MMNLKKRVTLVLLLMFTLAFASPVALCATSLDELQNETTTAQEGTTETTSGYGQVPSDDGNALTDYMKGYTPITAENMAVASETMSPIVSFLGTVAGSIMTLATAGIFVVTALDLVYIGLPFTRGLLNPQYAGVAPQGGMPMGGMSMGGYGGYGGYGRGMGMGMGMSCGQPAGGGMEHGIRRKWISDEAAFVVSAFSQGGAPQQQAMGGMPMAGGYGGMGMNMGMAGQGMQQPTPAMGKSVIVEYFKRRVVFVVVFAVCSIILMSSILLDCGINLAELLQRVLVKVNGEISTVQI